MNARAQAAPTIDETTSHVWGEAAAHAAAAIRTVVVIGAGQMGSGIAQVMATAGRNVHVVDVDAAGLERAQAGIASSVARLESKGTLTSEQANAATTNVHFHESLAAAVSEAGDIDLAIEAIVENADVKRAVFADLDAHLPPTAILASNTSSIPITLLGGATRRPQQVIGMHFMNPVPMLDLVEVIPGIDTAAETTNTVCALAHDIGKVPVQSADTPGFIANRVLMPLINEAFFCLQDGVGTAEAIDTTMRLGMKHPLGPLALADLIGLDTTLAILEVLHREIGDDKYRPCPLIRRHVEGGRLGRKAGRGVYDYAS